MHLVSLEQAAGVESHFTEFVIHARATRPDWTQGWLNPSRRLHPYFAARLGDALAQRIDAKYWHGIKIPSPLRTARCRSELRRARTDSLVFWNRSAKVRYALDAAGAEHCIHWEHGAAWDAGHEADRRRYFRRVPRAIANSRASARVLELLWDYRGAVSVCRNALRPSLVPSSPVSKPYPSGRIRIGVAARLHPVKGVALVLHAMQLLARQGLDAELRVAGAGPERERLESLAVALGIGARVSFLGSLRDMQAFYREVDCLVHPPLTEAFGLVTIEAAALGCPVIAAAIDGLPEAVADGVTGYTIVPTLPLADYAGLGGASYGLPALVYDPARDSLVATPLVDPSALAAAVARLVSSAASFEALSARASEHVLGAPSFARHVEDVMAVIDGSVAAAGALRRDAAAGGRA
jgi:glycosyltransferase involved in cell wall biosynthesis